MDKCVICGLTTEKPPNAQGFEFECPKCGSLSIQQEEEFVRKQLESFKGPGPAILSHYVRKMQKPNSYLKLTEELTEHILKNETLPRPQQQADNLILWMGDQLEQPGICIDLICPRLEAVVGVKDEDGLVFIIDHLMENRFVQHPVDNPYGHQLTFKGWARYEELKKGELDTRKAFMAMKYGDPLLDRVFRECFKPGAKQAGFDLGRLDEDPPAGLIDNRLRVEILTSRFLIADLTYGNQGAYWEAGYAEGLGKPVIYTCEETFFKEKKTHFDTNHQHTVPWKEDNLKAAEEQLKATIRATLPTEAKMRDD